MLCSAIFLLTIDLFIPVIRAAIKQWSGAGNSLGMCDRGVSGLEISLASTNAVNVVNS